MKRNESGFATVLLVILIVLGVGAIGLWRYADSRNTNIKRSPQPATNNEINEAKTHPDYTLNIKELGLKVPFDNPPYDDIVYEMRSLNTDGPKYIAAVYSKDLLERNLENCGKQCKGLDKWEKLSCNKSISIYYYDPSKPVADSPSPINPKNAGSNSSVHAGGVGPCEPSSDPKLYGEYEKFFKYIQTQVEKATDHKVTG